MEYLDFDPIIISVVSVVLLAFFLYFWYLALLPSRSARRDQSLVNTIRNY